MGGGVREAGRGGGLRTDLACDEGGGPGRRARGGRWGGGHHRAATKYALVPCFWAPLTGGKMFGASVRTLGLGFRLAG